MFVVFFALAFGQVSAYSCPNYMFATDLKKGDTNADVRVIQEILNLDKRTAVAYSGPGSKGRETTYFGVGTREALKRFQALFIEYIGIANGKFGPRTRTTMNAVCRGPFFNGGSGNVYDMGSTTSAVKDKLAPVIAVAGPNISDISQPFRAYLGGNEALQTPTLDGLIISNATAGDVRKVSSTTYTFLVTPNQDAGNTITLQFEADSISDLAGNKNETASNEWIVAVTGTRTSATSTDFVMPDITFPTVSGTDCSAVTSVDVNDYTNPCYGKVPTSYASLGQSSGDSGGGGGGGDQIMQMLSGLLQGLMKGLGGGGGMADGGGTGAAPGTCVCPGPLQGQPTIGLFGLAGPSGRFLETANPGMGKYTGKIGITPPGLCGQMVVKGKCVNPMADSTGAPVMGVIPPAPAFMWGGK